MNLPGYRAIIESPNGVGREGIESARKAFIEAAVDYLRILHVQGAGELVGNVRVVKAGNDAVLSAAITVSGFKE